MRHKREPEPVTAGEYDRAVNDTCRDIDRLRAAVWARYQGKGATAAAPELAAELRDLRAAVAALRSGTVLDG